VDMRLLVSVLNSVWDFDPGKAMISGETCIKGKMVVPQLTMSKVSPDSINCGALHVVNVSAWWWFQVAMSEEICS
jgi:hypothetical protein